MKNIVTPLFISSLPLTLLLSSLSAGAQEAIELGTNVSGTISTEGEVDWYAVTTDVLGDLTIQQTVWPGFIETQIEVYGPDEQTTLQADTVQAAAPGTYYLKVYSANNGTSTDVYTFNVTLEQAVTGNDVDGGGNSWQTALSTTLDEDVSDTIGPSSVTAGGVQDEDWYTITTDVVGDLAVVQTLWPEYIETGIEVFGPDDPTLAQGNTIPAAAPGTYYLRVTSANSGASSDIYTFHTTLTPSTTGNDIDNGANSSDAAIAITLETDVSDTIAPSSATTGLQDEDWYTITTDVVGDLAVVQTVWPEYIETGIEVFGPDDPTLAQGNTIPAAAPGTYYLRVASANRGSSSDIYTFHTTLEEASTGNDVDEGANDPEGAVPITVGATVTETIAPSKETAQKQDEDWYALSLKTAGELTVTQTEWPGYIETQLAVFGPDDPTTELTNPASPGTYYIRLWSANSGSSIDRYAFTTAFVSADGGDGTGGSAGEGNGDAGSAGTDTAGNGGTAGRATGGRTGTAGEVTAGAAGEESGSAGENSGSAGEESGAAGEASTAGEAGASGAGSGSAGEENGGAAWEGFGSGGKDGGSKSTNCTCRMVGGSATGSHGGLITCALGLLGSLALRRRRPSK